MPWRIKLLPYLGRLGTYSTYLHPSTKQLIALEVAWKHACGHVHRTEVGSSMGISDMQVQIYGSCSRGICATNFTCIPDWASNITRWLESDRDIRAYTYSFLIGSRWFVLHSILETEVMGTHLGDGPHGCSYCHASSACAILRVSIWKVPNGERYLQANIKRCQEVMHTYLRPGRTSGNNVHMHLCSAGRRMLLRPERTKESQHAYAPTAYPNAFLTRRKRTNVHIYLRLGCTYVSWSLEVGSPPCLIVVTGGLAGPDHGRPCQDGKLLGRPCGGMITAIAPRRVNASHCELAAAEGEHRLCSPIGVVTLPALDPYLFIHWESGVTPHTGQAMAVSSEVLNQKKPPSLTLPSSTAHKPVSCDCHPPARWRPALTSRLKSRLANFTSSCHSSPNPSALLSLKRM